MELQKTSRRYDLDWLRVLAFTLLLLFHTGMMFNTWGWHDTMNLVAVWAQFTTTFLGFAKRHLSWNSPYLKYGNEAVYPFYILHQSITVAIGFYMANWRASIAVKFVLLASGTFLGCWLIYEGLIKRNNMLRILFGSKPRKTNPATNALNEQQAVVSFGAK